MSKFNKFKDYLEDYYELLSVERSGLAIAIVIALIFFFIRINVSLVDRKADMDLFWTVINSDSLDAGTSSLEIAQSGTFNLKSFNPNIVSKEDLYDMGLPPSAVKSIINYRSAGFHYRKPEDLLKCFGVDQLLFDEIAPYIVILDTAPKNEKKSWAKSKPSKDQELRPFPFDPNTVSKAELEAMNLPNRFISGLLNFRKSGVKFYNIQDLDRVYSMTDEIREVIAPYLLFPDKPKSLYPKRENDIVAQRFRFDPNRISKDSLILLGVPKSAANIWINYRNGGAVFYAVNDLSSIFGLTASKLQEISDLMDFPVIPIKSLEVKAWPKQPSLNLDPNVVSLEDLMAIKGIGRSYGNRILWRRKQLGGFHKIDQIGESDNLPDSIFQAVRYHFVAPILDSLVKINVNTTSRRAFADHPYITYEVVDRIITHREFVGPKLDLDYLLKVELLSLKEAKLLGPYLTFD